MKYRIWTGRDGSKGVLIEGKKTKSEVWECSGISRWLSPSVEYRLGG